MSLHDVKLWSALRIHAQGEPSVQLQAKNIRELLGRLVQEYPGMKATIDRGVAVSVDGVLYRDSWETELPEGAEIFLLPRIQGG